MITEMHTESRTLEQLRVAVVAMVSEDLINDAAWVASNANLEILKDHTARALVFRLMSHVLAEKLATDAETTELRVPATWWQHFKQDHSRLFPKWYLRRRPVKMTGYKQTVSFRQYRTYPNAKIALPPDRFGQPVIVEFADRGTWTRSD